MLCSCISCAWLPVTQQGMWAAEVCVQGLGARWWPGVQRSGATIVVEVLPAVAGSGTLVRTCIQARVFVQPCVHALCKIFLGGVAYCFVQVVRSIVVMH